MSGLSRGAGGERGRWQGEKGTGAVNNRDEGDILHQEDMAQRASMDIHCGKFGILTVTPDFKPGDPPPVGYLDWHAWADVQEKAGLSQVKCCMCGKWKYPQELSEVVVESKAYQTKRDAVAGRNPIIERQPVCLGCNERVEK